MAFSWKLHSRPPHDFFLCLDVDNYFDIEHDPASIPEQGFTRSLPLTEKDILVTIFFNGDPEDPVFTIECDEQLDDAEKKEANRVLARILGTDLDLRPFYKKIKNDPLMQPLTEELYGLKRLSRANLFQDAVNRIIIAQINHKPTAKKMVNGVRMAYSTRFDTPKGTFYAWPRPERLIGADPVSLKQYGLSLRKGEYVVGLAHEFVSGNMNMEKLENLHPLHFYNTILKVRGIGPTTAQDLMLFRNRSDAWFPSHIDKGEEKGIRKWIIMSYGGDPDNTTDENFKKMIAHWKGNESLALEHLFVNWVLSEKRREYRSKKA